VTDAAPISRSASDLLRSLGLLVDGPRLWSKPVNSRAPGIFVVELSAPFDVAPIDIVALRRWLEHVPGLTLDGAQPTAEDIAKRLHEFWLPGEPVVYVGRSTRQNGARVNSMYNTPLGDARPHAGGHWLKTLSVLRELRIWWAETNAGEEYEDALLAAIAARNAQLGRDAAQGGLLPFANLVTADGVTKRHGLASSLRADATDSSQPAKTKSGSPARRKSTVTGAQTRARRAAPPKARAGRPTLEPTLVSREGLANLVNELDDLRTVQRPLIIDRVATARSHGDLKENAEYEYARKEQSFMEGRIQTLEQMIRNAQVIEATEASDTVRVGSTVDVESEGDPFTYVIVGPTEANPAQGKLSNASPVGRALLGARAGQEVRVELPAGAVSYRVVAIR
jgi:transcription elongation factor GreA